MSASIEPIWHDMDTIPEDGSAVLCKLKSGHVIVTWHLVDDAWLSEGTDLFCAAVLDDEEIPDTSWENRIGWAPYEGPHPAALPEDRGDAEVFVAAAGPDDDDEIYF